MAMSHSLLEYGNEEVGSDVVTNICFNCNEDGKLQPSLYFCFDCGVYGRYMCGMCFKNHNKFLNNHEVEKIENQSTSRRAKHNEGKLKALQQLNGEVQKRIRGHPYMTGLAIAGGILWLGLYNSSLGHIIICCLVVLVNIYIAKENDGKLKILKQSNWKLQEDSNRLQKEKADLEIQLRECKEANVELKTRFDEFNRESKKEKKEQIINKVKEIDELISRAKENDVKLKALEKLNREMQKDNNNHQKEKDQLKKELLNCKVNLELANNISKIKYAGFDRKLAEYENRISDIDKEKDDLIIWLKKKSKLVVASIEIGNTSSGYAFSFQHEYQTDPSKISVNKSWVAGSGPLVSFKTPTVVLFDGNKKFHEFGYCAENLYGELAFNGKHHEYHFFRRFMSTLQEEKIDLHHEIVDDKGKKMKLIDVLSAAIKYLKDHFLQHLGLDCRKVQKNYIHWVLPVPTICADTAKQIMREAAYKADIDDACLSLVSKPVAACLYCQKIPEEMCRDSKSVKSTIQLLSRPGTKFMVIDLGGYSAAFTIFERQSDDSIMEVKAITGVKCGENMVKNEFLGLFRNIIGSAAYKKVIDRCPEDYLDLQREVEVKLRSVKPDINGRITTRVPVSFIEEFKERNHETINQATERSPFRGKIAWLGDKAKIDTELAKDMFKPCTTKIVGYIQDLMKDKDVQSTGIFLMVGDFSESLMAQEALVKAFPNVNIIIPEEPGYGVMKGAVIYGYQH